MYSSIISSTRSKLASVVVISAPTRSAPRTLLRRLYAFNGEFVAVAARSWSVAIVKIGRAIKRGREENVVALAERKNVVSEQSEVRCDDELDLLSSLRRGQFRVLDDFCDEREVEQRLAALKLDLDARAGAFQSDA